VPGLGNVNVPATIDDQLAATEPGPKMKELTWDWAQLVNEDVPYIWYATKLYQFSYLSKDFDNWPPKDDQGSSPLWDIMGANLSGGMVLAMEQGYIRPKG
jgi:peptide/nickel transport system substrate-binding protein